MKKQEKTELRTRRIDDVMEQEENAHRNGI